MPRFVVLEHAKGGEAHFDLMLERGDVLVTFSFTGFPAAGTTCERLFDHRTRYLDYEGEIDGGRGTVRRVESGNYDLLSETEDAIHVQLRGARLTGRFRLTRTDGQTWQLIAEEDASPPSPPGRGSG